jgi:hypothetical protein
MTHLTFQKMLLGFNMAEALHITVPECPIPRGDPILLAPTEDWRDLIESSAASAWADFSTTLEILAGSAALDAMRDLYFSLLKQLIPHSKRNVFTKQECIVLLSELSATPIAARGSRQPVKILNERLSEVVAGGPGFRVAELQAAIKKCAAHLKEPRAS